jgi:signal peptidase I
MRAYDGIKAERGRKVNLETAEFLDHARRLLSSSITLEIRMSGGSMSPAIEDGDVVTIEPVGETQLRAGDIVLYQSRSDTAVIHRVIKIDRSSPERAAITRGDAASQTDPPVPLSRIIGRIKLVERAGEEVDTARPRRGLIRYVVRALRRLRFWS